MSDQGLCCAFASLVANDNHRLSQRDRIGIEALTPEERMARCKIKGLTGRGKCAIIYP